MDDAVAVALIDIARAAGTALGFGMMAAARPRRKRGDPRWKAHSVSSGTILSDSEFVQLKALMPTDCKSSARMRASEGPRNGPITSRARSGLWAM
jgi:hypothetical protein